MGCQRNWARRRPLLVVLACVQVAAGAVVCEAQTTFLFNFEAADQMDFWTVPPELSDNFELVWDGAFGNSEPGSMQFRLERAAETKAQTPCFPRTTGVPSISADLWRSASNTACGVGIDVFTTPTCELEPYHAGLVVRGVESWGSLEYSFDQQSFPDDGVAYRFFFFSNGSPGVLSTCNIDNVLIELPAPATVVPTLRPLYLSLFAFLISLVALGLLKGRFG